MSSVLVIGGGVIGCACALVLARRGLRVTVLERSPSRAEAPGETGASSWAAAGILSVHVATASDGPLSRLCVAGRARYASFAEEIRALSGFDVELRSAGVLRPAFDVRELGTLEAEIAWQAPAGLRVEHLDASSTRAIEPAISAEVIGAIRFPDDPRIDPPALLAALRIAIERAGATLRTGASVERVIERDGVVRGVALADGSVLEASYVVVAAGSWSSLVHGAALPAESVAPARGQIVELKLDRQILRGVVDGVGTYLSPRDDGRVLVGSTIERIGYRTGATAATVRDLIANAIRLVPALAAATVTRAWAGFRPVTPDELPVLGATSIEGLVVATGHYRNGILLAPVTADIVAALVLGERVEHDLSSFSPQRLAL